MPESVPEEITRAAQELESVSLSLQRCAAVQQQTKSKGQANLTQEHLATILAVSALADAQEVIRLRLARVSAAGHTVQGISARQLAQAQGVSVNTALKQIRGVGEQDG